MVQVVLLLLLTTLMIATLPSLAWRKNVFWGVVALAMFLVLSSNATAAQGHLLKGSKRASVAHPPKLDAELSARAAAAAGWDPALRAIAHTDNLQICD